MPLTKMVTEFIEKLISDGEADKDHSAILKYYEKISSFNLV